MPVSAIVGDNDSKTATLVVILPLICALTPSTMLISSPFAAIALTTDTSTLTAIGNDYGYEQVFSRQIHGLGQPGDTLIAISTSGNSPNVIAAIHAARERKMHVIALTGKKGGKIADLLQMNEAHVCIPSDITSYIQESHIMILHCWCEIIDQCLMQVHLEHTVAV